MKTNQKSIGFGVWLTWVLASTLGFGVGAVLGIIILIAAQVPEGTAFPILFGIIFGAVGGLAQWLVLRRQIPDSGLWIPFNALGLMLAIATSASMAPPIGNPFLVVAVIYGLIGGFLQWLILEKRGVSIGWWIAASLLGSFLGSVLNGPTAAAIPWDEFGLSAKFLLSFFFLGVPFGLGVGIITGGVLVWFLRHPRTESTGETSTQTR